MVCFLKYKFETFDNLRKFKEFVKSQSGSCTKTFQIAKDGEFLSNEFNAFWEENDICKELIETYIYI